MNQLDAAFLPSTYKLKSQSLQALNWCSVAIKCISFLEFSFSYESTGNIKSHSESFQTTHGANSNSPARYSWQNLPATVVISVCKMYRHGPKQANSCLKPRTSVSEMYDKFGVMCLPPLSMETAHCTPESPTGAAARQTISDQRVNCVPLFYITWDKTLHVFKSNVTVFIYSLMLIFYMNDRHL